MRLLGLARSTRTIGQAIADVAENLAPVVASIPDQSFSLNTVFSRDFSGYFSDSEDDILTLSTTSTLPAGVTFSNGVLAGTPSALGSSIIVIRASDGNSVIDSAGFTVAIVDPSSLYTGIGQNYTKAVFFSDTGTLAENGTPAVDGGRVVTWQDQSGNGNHATQSSPTNTQSLILRQSDANISGGISLEVATVCKGLRVSLEASVVYAVVQHGTGVETVPGGSNATLLGGPGPNAQDRVLFQSGVMKVGNEELANGLSVGGGLLTTSPLPLKLSVVRIELKIDKAPLDQFYSLGTAENQPSWPFKGSLVAFAFTDGTEPVQAFTGWLAHRTLSTATLVEGHQYKSTPPTTAQADAEVLASVPTPPATLPGVFVTDSGTWRVDAVTNGYRWTLDENPGWESFMAVNNTGTTTAKTVNGQSMFLAPYSVRFAQTAAPVPISAARIRAAVAAGRWLPYRTSRAAGWPVTSVGVGVGQRGSLSGLDPNEYDPSILNGTTSGGDNMVGVISGAGGEYLTSRGATDQLDAEIIALALLDTSTDDATIVGHSKSVYDVAFAMMGYPNRTPFDEVNNVLRDPQKPIGDTNQYEYRLAGGEEHAHIDSHPIIPDWPMDHSHLDNTGWALWMGTEDPRIGILVQGQLAFNMANFFEYKRTPYLSGNGMSVYRAGEGQSRGTYNALTAMWRARDVVERVDNAQDLILWSKPRVLEMYSEMTAHIESQADEIANSVANNGDGNQQIMAITRGFIGRMGPNDFSRLGDTDITLISRSLFMDGQYGAASLYMRAVAGESIGIKAYEALGRHFVARLYHIGGSRGVDGLAGGAGSDYPLGPPSAVGSVTADIPPPFTNEVEWANYIKNLGIMRTGSTAAQPTTTIEDTSGHTAIQCQFILLAAQDLVARGIIGAIPNLDNAITTFAAAVAATPMGSLRHPIWHKHCHDISTAA